MKFLRALSVLSLCVVAFCDQEGNYGSGSQGSQLKAGTTADEVVMASSLNIDKKPQLRHTRDINGLFPYPISGLRVKRQHKGKKPSKVGSSQSSANAAANNNFFGPNKFGASAANAQAQGFQSQGPLGGFGASAANTQTQSFTADRKGIQGSAGASTSQVYNLPNGHTINVAFTNGFSAGPNGIAGSNANGVTYT